MISRSLIFTLSFLTALSTWASDFTYGAEFELVNPSINSDWERGGQLQAAEAKLKYVKNLLKLCQTLGCDIEAVQGKWADMTESRHADDYKVTFQDGWWFKVSHDPGCVEITTKPSTKDELKAREKLLDAAIFDSGKNLGFYIPDGEAAHFNIGFMKAFENNGEHFLRFFTDYHSRPELALGALGNDIYNGPPLSVMPKKMRDALSELVRDHHSDPMPAIELSRRIERDVYLRPYLLSWGGAEHYQMIGLKHINSTPRQKLMREDRPFELRAIWSQKNMAQFILLAELFEGRIEYLKTLTDPFVYVPSDQKSFSPLEQAAGFYNYVTEAGLSFEKFKTLLPVNLQKIGLELIKVKAQKMKSELESAQEKLRPHFAPRRCAMMFAS